MRITEEQYLELTGKRQPPNGNPVKNKYSAKPQTVDNIRFASAREANRYRELNILLRCNLISDLKLQPPFKLGTDAAPVLIRSKRYPNGRRATYYADFSYFDLRTRLPVIEDSKGYDTPVSRLKRAIVEAQYLIKIVLV